jgi:calcineurin-like phosphoesterase family protein
MNRYWTSDIHANHANIIKHSNRPQFDPADFDGDNWRNPEVARDKATRMNDMLVREANMRVHPDDQVIHVGDFLIRKIERGVMGGAETPESMLRRLSGHWTLIEGNHDAKNKVRTVGRFLSCMIGKYHVGVQHVPLSDEDLVTMWGFNITKAERAEYARKCFNFIICGHVHERWQTKFVAGLWHVNVGVDANHYRPLKDQEVITLYERARRAT